MTQAAEAFALSAQFRLLVIYMSLSTIGGIRFYIKFIDLGER
jgi:hypothetical protein